MSTSFSATSGHALAVPPTREFTAAWIAYVLFAVAIFMWWPALLGLIINYSKRGDPDAGFIASHHRWMIGTFWWSLLGFVLCVAAILAAVWPLVRDVVMQAIASGGDFDSAGFELNVDWSSIFTTAGVASLAGIGLFVIWLWFIYRVLRGMFTLHEARAVG